MQFGLFFCTANSGWSSLLFTISEVKDRPYLTISNFSGIQPSPYSIACNTSLGSGKSEHHLLANLIEGFCVLISILIISYEFGSLCYCMSEHYSIYTPLSIQSASLRVTTLSCTTNISTPSHHHRMAIGPSPSCYRMPTLVTPPYGCLLHTI